VWRAHPGRRARRRLSRSPGCSPATSRGRSTGPRQRGADRKRQKHRRHAGVRRACRRHRRRREAPDVKRHSNALEAGLAALRQRGHYRSTISVIKDELIAKHAISPPDVFDAFAAQASLRRAPQGGQDRKRANRGRRVHRRVMEIAASRSPTASRRTATSSMRSSGTR